MHETKNKILSTLIVTIGAFLGFQALSYIIGIYQLDDSLKVALYIYAFHIFWLTFLFDLHLKKRGVLANAKLNNQGLKMIWLAFQERIEHLRNWQYFRHYQNYLVLPGIIYWTTVSLMFINPFSEGFKQFLLTSSTLALAVAYWFMKEHISRKLEHDHQWLKVLALVKVYAAYLSFSAILGVTFYFGYQQAFVFCAVLSLTFLLIYQALFQHRLISFRTLLLVIIMSLVLAALSILVYQNWTTEYLTAGLVLVAVYNTMWGILHHHLDQTLNKKIALEYVAMMVLVLSIVLAGHNFDQKVI